MVNRKTIRAYARRIARRFHPEKIILFGSYAYGTPTEDSDVDLLVILPFDEERERPSLKIRQTLRSGFPMDLIARTPETVQRRLAEGDSFLTEVMRRGEVLYEA